MWLTLANLPEWRAIIAGRSDVLMGDLRAGSVGPAVGVIHPNK
jgi:hypothetical protein